MSRLLPLAALAAVAVSAAAASAAPVAYTLDPSRSSLTVGGSFSGFAATPQSPGSDTAAYAGTILADLEGDGNGGIISFPGGSSIDALPQAAPQQPAPGGAAGSAPADYGLRFSLPLVGTALAAGRDFNFDLTAPQLFVGGNAFVASGLTVGVNNGVLDFDAGAAGGGSEDFVGETSPANGLDGLATLSLVGSVETLTIPVEATLTFTALSPDDSTVTITGTLVATRLVPEPTTAGLVLGTVGLLALRRRH